MTLMTLGTLWWVRLLVRLGVFREEPVTHPRPALPPPPAAAPAAPAAPRAYVDLPRSSLEMQLRKLDGTLAVVFGKAKVDTFSGHYVRYPDKRWLS